MNLLRWLFLCTWILMAFTLVQLNLRLKRDMKDRDVLLTLLRKMGTEAQQRAIHEAARHQDWEQRRTEDPPTYMGVGLGMPALWLWDWMRRRT